jgi:signal recognition particle receptor subunit beta
MTEDTRSLPVAAPPGQLLQLKIVYWGPAEAGKTTSLLAVADIFQKFRLDEVIVVQTTGGRTLWNEYCAFQFTIPAGPTAATVVVHLSALTGQERFLNTREFAGSSIDGCLFVADCRPDYVAATMRSYEELVAFAPKGTPIVVQANFQDIPTSIRPAKLGPALDARVKAKGTFSKVVPTVATKGTNVAAAFLDLLYAVLTKQ